MAKLLSATPRTGGKSLHANLASRTMSPEAKRAFLLGSLQRHADQTGVDYCVTVQDTETGEIESLRIRAKR